MPIVKNSNLFVLSPAMKEVVESFEGSCLTEKSVEEFLIENYVYSVMELKHIMQETTIYGCIRYLDIMCPCGCCFHIVNKPLVNYANRILNYQDRSNRLRIFSWCLCGPSAYKKAETDPDGQWEGFIFGDRFMLKIVGKEELKFLGQLAMEFSTIKLTPVGDSRVIVKSV